MPDHYKHSKDAGKSPRKGASAKQEKIKTVMREFHEGKLKSSSGVVVTNPKQALAIAFSKAREEGS